MTTTVCDLVNRLITADTRWSCGADGTFELSDGKRYFIYCDDTGFDKITKVGRTALITAGNGVLIAKWKKWWKQGDRTVPHPETEFNGENAVNLAILDLDNNEVLFDAGAKQVLHCIETDAVKAFASGSGAFFAASTLLTTGCARKAVEVASQLDYCTSKFVSYLCYSTDSDNLNHVVDDYSEIVDGIVKRGYIMELQAANSSSMATEVGQHPLSKEISGKFGAGEAVASAPVPGMGTFQWDESTESKFQAAMAKVYNLRDKG